ncbi:hypothetical protein CPG38_04350 [Malaciobacter marinus]|uniref:hypothetical protein n=1 Tax=Malaciobacter marinus TaxID=505249 RepID=UPI000C06D4AE|nr:hypothetical protein [Malaciobacter marinus]PHO13194.1 hypothetical protein CPG38_04350 [Malaciobacter marinus]
MKKILIKSLLIVFVANLITGCSLKSNDLIELKPKLNNLTKRANSAIKRRGIEVSKVNEYLATKNPILIESFKDYDLKFKYENEVTVVLVCKDEKALYEDLSCDLKIDNDYSSKNVACAFIVKKINCED